MRYGRELPHTGLPQSAKGAVRYSFVRQAFNNPILPATRLADHRFLIQGYTATLNRLQTLPQGSQTSLLVLTPPPVGAFFGPRIAPYLLGGGCIGLMAMAGLALLLDWSEKSFRDPDEISQQLSLPILGHIPQIAKALVAAR